jgi:tRNA (guanine9-N1)-methyltransferase
MLRLRLYQNYAALAPVSGTAVTFFSLSFRKTIIFFRFLTISIFQELNHLANQLKRVYGANKASKRPFHLHFLSLKPEGRIWRKCCEKNDGFLDYCLTFDGRSIREAFTDTSRVVYLSPDSPTELESLETDNIYIIGGLVDDSVQSRVSLTYAEQQGLRTARLPISRYMRRRSGESGATFKQILTINQIFEILLTLYETEDWKAALIKGVPPRTGFVVDETVGVPPRTGFDVNETA